MQCVDKQFLKMAKPFIESGVLRLETGGKHAALYRADGHKIPLPGSSSDHRAVLNFKSQLRKFAAGEFFGKMHCTACPVTTD